MNSQALNGFTLFHVCYLSCQSCRGWSLSHGPQGHVSSTQRWWRAPSGWCSPGHQAPWWPGYHWTQRPGRCHAHYRWEVLLSSWQSCLVQEEAPLYRNWLLKKKRGQRQLYSALWFQLQTITVTCAVTYHTACAATSQSKCHDRSPSQYGWFPVQYWPGWRWLAHHRSPSACWGKGPGCLCQAHIQSSY